MSYVQAFELLRVVDDDEPRRAATITQSATDHWCLARSFATTRQTVASQSTTGAANSNVVVVVFTMFHWTGRAPTSEWSSAAMT